jgi:hypothetical protein
VLINQQIYQAPEDGDGVVQVRIGALAEEVRQNKWPRFGLRFDVRPGFWSDVRFGLRFDALPGPYSNT